MATNYIPDGYTEEALIKEIPRMHGSVRFTYRAMLNDKIREVQHSWDLISAAERTRRIYAVIEKQLVNWDITKEDPKTKQQITVPIKAAEFPHIKRMIIERVYNIVMQFDTSDEVSREDEGLDLDKVLGGGDEAKN